MPMTHYFVVNAHERVGIWRIAETEDYFLRKLPLSALESAELARLSGRRRLEWLAGKFLLREMTGWAFSVEKDEYGKPHLTNTNLKMSISHSDNMVAVIVGYREVGIDIQYLTPKLEQIAWRIMNEAKFKVLEPDTRLAHLHVYWGAKEALYKAYGKKALDFRQNIVIQPFKFQPEQGQTRGYVEKEAYKKHFNIFYKQINQFTLVYAIEQD